MNSAFRDEYNLKSLKKIKLPDFEMYITPRYIQHYIERAYEPFSTNIVKTYLKPNSTFVDVGAHFGYYSLLAARSRKNINIVAIEPIKETAEILSRNMRLNNVNNAEVYNCAASNREGLAPFNLTEASDSAGFYKHTLAKTKRKITVNTVRLDSILKGKRVDFIKIDVEGHEIAVLEGLKNTLNKNNDIKLLVEFNPSLQESAGFKTDKLITVLEDLGFEVFLVDEINKQYYRLTDNRYHWTEITQTNSSNKTYYTNLFCIKKNEVVFATYFAHSAQLEGAERSMLDLLTQIVDYQSLSHVVFPGIGPMVDKVSNEAVAWSIVEYASWGTLTQQVNIDNYYNSLIHCAEAIKQIEKINPHVIYTNTNTIPWGAFISQILSKPHIWHIHEFGVKDHGLNYDISFNESVRLIDVLSDRVIYNSAAVKKEYEKMVNKGKGSIVYYNVNIPQESLVNIEKVYKSQESLKLIILGRVTRAKGQHLALQAVGELIKEGLNIELLVLGSFNEEDEYFKSIKKLIESSATKGVYFKQFVDNPYPYINQADVLLMCSINEAFGRVIVEGMRLRKPVIANNSGASPELIRDNYNGFLFNSIGGLKDKIRIYYNNRSLIEKMGNQGFSFAKNNFSKEKYAKKIYRLLLKVKNIEKRRMPNLKDVIYKLIVSMFTKDNKTQELELSYKRLIDEHKRLIDEYQELRTQKEYMQGVLNRITLSKTYIMWQAYCKIRKKALELVGWILPSMLKDK